MLGGGRFAGTVLGAGRARGFGAGTEPGGGLEGGPRGFGTGWSGNLIASGALTGTTSTGDAAAAPRPPVWQSKFYGAFSTPSMRHPTHWLIFTQTATGSATSRDAGPGTRGFFDRGPAGGDVALLPSGDGKADRAASNDA